jgi:hypothetical protein
LVAVTSLRGPFRFRYELQTVAMDSAPWLFAGLLLAGVVKMLQPSDAAVARALGGRGSWGSSVAGAGAGLLLPCCSCGVMPVAAGVAEQGASAAAAIAMVFVASGSGLDSFFYFAGLAGPGVACLRMLCVALLGVVSTLAAVAATSTPATNAAASTAAALAAAGAAAAETTAEDSSCCAREAAGGSKAAATSVVADACCGHGSHGALSSAGDTVAARSAVGAVSAAAGRFLAAVAEGFEQVAPWVAAGVGATAAAAAWAPASGTWGLLGQSSSSGAYGADALSRLALFAAALPIQVLPPPPPLSHSLTL